MNLEELLDLYEMQQDNHTGIQASISKLKKIKKRDSGEQTLLDLFSELEVDVRSNLEHLRGRIRDENPSFSN